MLAERVADLDPLGEWVADFEPVALSDCDRVDGGVWLGVREGDCADPVAVTVALSEIDAVELRAEELDADGDPVGVAVVLVGAVADVEALAVVDVLGELELLLDVDAVAVLDNVHVELRVVV